MLSRDRGRQGCLVARLLAGAWRTPLPPVDASAEELAQIASLVHRSGAGALAWWRLRATMLADTPAAQGFREAYRLHALEAEVHALKTGEALRRLEAAGVEALVVKGWAIARHYPEVGLRQYTDLDLIVRPGQCGVAGTALAVGRPLDYAVDLHDGPAHLDHLSFDELAERAEEVSVGDATVRVLSPEDHLRVLSLHMLRHGAYRPLWLCDLGVAIESRPAGFDWPRCLGSVSRRADWVACAIGLAHRLLGARIEDTPVAARAARLPRWLVRAVLHTWDHCEGVSHRPPVFHALLRSLGDPMRLREELRLRWHRPIQATLDVGGPFNELPRLPFQLAALARRAPELAHAIVEGRRRRGARRPLTDEAHRR